MPKHLSVNQSDLYRSDTGLGTDKAALNPRERCVAVYAIGSRLTLRPSAFVLKAK